MFFFVNVISIFNVWNNDLLERYNVLGYIIGLAKAGSNATKISLEWNFCL